MLLAGIVVLSNLTLKPVPLAMQAEMMAQMPVTAGIFPASVKIETHPGLPLTVGLERFQNLTIVGMSDMKAQASLDTLWDGRDEQDEQNEDELVHVLRQERKAQAQQEMRAEFPALDIQRLTESGARDFAAREFDLGPKALTGREILARLLTPHAVVDAAAPDPRAVDFSTFGRSEAELRALSDREGVSYHQLSRALDGAHRVGLVYRLFDTQTRRMYHGVTYEGRVMLGLVEEPRAAKPAAVDDSAALSAFGEQLMLLAKKAEGLKPKDELFEFTAQTVAATLAAGKLSSGRLPTAFAARMNAAELQASSVQSAVLALVESADGTAWFEPAVALAQAAVAEGLVDAAELRQVLDDLR